MSGARPGTFRAATWIAAAWMAAAAGARAETVYVSSELKLAVHEKASLDSAVIRLLPIGMSLELLERRGRVARVRLGTGLDGWVEDAFITGAPPASPAAEAASGAPQDLERALAEMEQRAIIAETKLLALAAAPDSAPEPADEAGETTPAGANDAETDPDGEAPDAGAEDVPDAGQPLSGAAPGDEPSGRPTLQPMDSETLREVERLALENQRLREALAAHELGDDGAGTPAGTEFSAAEAASAAGIAVAAAGKPGDISGRAADAGVLYRLFGAHEAGPQEWMPEWNRWQWLFSVSAVAFAFAIGAWLVDVRVRRRLGGFSV